MLLHVVEFLLEFACHFIPHVHESHFDHFELFLPRIEQRLTLARMLRLKRRHLLLVSLNNVLRLAEQLLSTVGVEFLPFKRLGNLDLFLQDLGILIEATLPLVVRALLHFDDSRRKMQSLGLDSAVLD